MTEPPNPLDNPRTPIAPWEWIVVAVATLVGLFLRTWNLGEIPPGMWFDEGLNGIDVLDMMREPGIPLVFDRFGLPREPLFLYLQTIAISLGGTTAVAMRALSAVIGTLTIPAVWWMARTIAGPRVAIAALVAFVFMRWHIHFSRLAFRTILTPLFASLIVAFMVRWFRGMGGRNIVAAGALGGLSLYTYLSMRLFLVAMAIAFIVFLVQSRGRGAACVGWKAVGGGVLAGTIIFAPLAIHYVKNPENFGGRQDQVSLIGEGTEGLALMARQARDIALMGIIRGDHETKHNLPGRPRFVQAYFVAAGSADSEAMWEDARAMGSAPDVHGTGHPVFDVITGLMLYAGLAMIFFRAFKGRIEEITVVLWLLIGALASVLSFGAPNMLRLLLLTPIAALALGLAAIALFDRLARSPLRKPGGITAVALLAAWFGQGELRRYFIDWPRHPETYFKFNTNFFELANEVRLLPSEQRPDIFYMPDFLADFTSIIFLLGDTDVRIVGDSAGEAPTTTEDTRAWYAVPASPPFPPLMREVPENARAVRRLQHPDGAVWCVIWETGTH